MAVPFFRASMNRIIRVDSAQMHSKCTLGDILEERSHIVLNVKKTTFENVLISKQFVAIILESSVLTQHKGIKSVLWGTSL